MTLKNRKGKALVQKRWKGDKYRFMAQVGDETDKDACIFYFCDRDLGK